MERFATYSFSSGCISHSSVDVADRGSNKSQSSPNHTLMSDIQCNRKFKASISAKIQKIIKNLSHMFQFYKVVEEDEEYEMVIGLPTDVVHIGHIGWDGFNTESLNAIKSWDKSPEFFAVPTISLKQFEMAMAAQNDDGDAHHQSDHGP